MSRLGTRLARLEKVHSVRLEGARCPLCRSWPKARILYIDGDGHRTWQTPDVPEACPHCGWRPIVVEVVEVKDWESVGRHGVR
jgi:DNA-directed RNA polymerase subunit RPC12/RpoP